MYVLSDAWEGEDKREIDVYFCSFYQTCILGILQCVCPHWQQLRAECVGATTFSMTLTRKHMQRRHLPSVILCLIIDCLLEL